MRERHYAFAALLLALGSICYTAWVHHNSQRFAQQALREREREVVHANASVLKRIYQDMLGSESADFNPDTYDPKTLQEAIYPMMVIVRRMQGAPSEPATRPSAR